MKAPTVRICSLIAAGLFGAIGCTPAGKDVAAAPERIGVYDSRSVVIAFVNSKSYEQTEARVLEEKFAELKKAEAEGDRERIAELKAWGKARQEARHEQGFSTAPVDDILKHIEKKLPAVMKEAGVERLVSKWDRGALAKLRNAEKVNVTMRLVDAFEPTEKQRAYAVEIQKHEPLPLDRMKEDDH